MKQHVHPPVHVLHRASVLERKLGGAFDEALSTTTYLPR
jgi:hypothetical protein